MSEISSYPPVEEKILMCNDKLPFDVFKLDSEPPILLIQRAFVTSLQSRIGNFCVMHMTLLAKNRLC